MAMYIYIILFAVLNILAIQTRAEDSLNSVQMTLSPVNQTTYKNGIASFFCKASGNPTPEFYWKKNGRLLHTRNKQRYNQFDFEHGSLLRIEPVRPKDNGDEFECFAHNKVVESNNVRASAYLKVYQECEAPTGFPTITRSPILKVVEFGRDAVMMCSASGDPDPDIYWLKDYIPLDLNDNPKFQLLSNGLQLKDAVESDEGKYECIAHNKHGTAYSYAVNLYVRVRHVPPLFSEAPQSTYNVMSGDNLNITCEAEGTPLPYVKWTRVHDDITPEDKIPLGRNVLELTDIQKSANYTCVAASSFGRIVTVTSVIVIDENLTIHTDVDNKGSTNVDDKESTNADDKESTYADDLLIVTTNHSLTSKAKNLLTDCDDESFSIFESKEYIDFVELLLQEQQKTNSLLSELLAEVQGLRRKTN